jgi:hypothetical protein
MRETFLCRAICRGTMMPISRATSANSDTMFRIVTASHQRSYQKVSLSKRHSSYSPTASRHFPDVLSHVRGTRHWKLAMKTATMSQTIEKAAIV